MAEPGPHIYVSQVQEASDLPFYRDDVMRKPEELKPPPRTCNDEKLLRRALRIKRLSPQELEMFEKWFSEIDTGRRASLSERERLWVNDVIDREEPRYANLVSRGLVPRGKEVDTPDVLKVLPLKPPGRT
jgi:hypothetical protein